MAPSAPVILQFGEFAAAFRAVDDRVMGGVSQSHMVPSEDGHALFHGHLSLENNGGFASVRASELGLDLSAVSTLTLRVRGDGRRYKIRLHDDTRFDGVAFEFAFDTDAGEWIELALPLESFRPVWRGRLVRDATPLNRQRVSMLGFMVSDGQQGDFQLEVDWLAGE